MTRRCDTKSPDHRPATAQLQLTTGVTTTQPIARIFRGPGKTGAAWLAAALLAGCATPTRPPVDRLAAGFANPPASARPHSWWHWLGGNITAEGAERDLEWMHRIGIGGVQLFEGSVGTPRIVARPMPWMSPAWRDTLRSSVATANRLGLDFAVASSPGWSASGAPFVQPADAMKKLVWSQTDVAGDETIRLPPPPDVAGPFQDIALEQETPRYYRDVAVLAFPAPADDAVVATVSATPNTMIPLPMLQDGRFADAVDLPFGADGTARLDFTFAKPAALASVVIGLDAPHGFGAPPAPKAVVEISTDGGQFTPVATLSHNSANVLAANFPSVVVRAARIRLIAQPGGFPPIAAGVAPFPAPPIVRTARVSEARFTGVPMVNRWPEKAGFATALDYRPLANSPMPDAVIPETVRDLTRHLRPDGTLDWTPPPGRWRILRFGYSLTGKRNAPAPEEATGLEVDKLDADAVSRYIERYLAMYADAAAPNHIGGLLSDSIEAGNQNWTPGMIAAFRRLRGYDPLPWMPALTGVVIGDATRTDRFLWDFRQTISDLLTEAHYAVLARSAHARGMTYYAEALEDHRPQLGDDLAMRAQAHVPMGAMWWAPAGGPPRTTLIADLQGAASVASIYGKPIVAAESLTSFGHPFALAPGDLKSTIDLELALGVNRIIIHTSPHQPLDAAPGFALSPWLGQTFSRLESWAEMAGGLTGYIARASYLMQQGRHAADIAYFIGEDTPLTALYGDQRFAGLPTGYGFDFVGSDGLAKALSVEPDGTLRSRGGVGYRMLVLGGTSDRLTLATLRRIDALAAAGAMIVGTRPLASPSLADEPEEWQVAVDRLWARRTTYASVKEALAAARLSPDWSGATDDQVAVRHRVSSDGDIWFVSNRTGKALSFDLSLRATGRQPEIWDAVGGKAAPAPFRMENGRTIVPLRLDRTGSTFIVLRKLTTAAIGIAPSAEHRQLATLDDGWTLSLRDQPPIALDRLRSWTTFGEPERRYYSGTGVYRRTIDVPGDWIANKRRVELDLGTVGAVAEIRVNDRSAGIAWTTPYAIDVTDLLRAGRNQVEIRVANVWANRLIGDRQPGAVPVGVTYGPTYQPDAPLLASGLLGPVRLVSSSR